MIARVLELLQANISLLQRLLVGGRALDAAQLRLPLIGGGLRALVLGVLNAEKKQIQTEWKKEETR